eukprot:TRINITY_DN11355_c0_g1_i4.p1 TRINITY_DN11355_c0_g1~~TRINITY_DN11355_c0_g1_i4.p1  ORF type:complete len:895 (+),score=214.22 TRINITY_DN11355_c0_g1_i4:55-2685(+)
MALPNSGPLPGFGIDQGASPWQPSTTPDGKTYYFNVLTRETRWDNPHQLPDRPLPLPPNWIEHRAADGQVYYFNTETRVSTYKRPTPAQGKPAKKKSVVARVSVPDTPWMVVRASDNSLFYYNTATKKSTKKLPADLQGLDLPVPPAVETDQSAAETNTESLQEPATQLHAPPQQLAPFQSMHPAHPAVEGGQAHMPPTLPSTGSGRAHVNGQGIPSTEHMHGTDANVRQGEAQALDEQDAELQAKRAKLEPDADNSNKTDLSARTDGANDKDAQVLTDASAADPGEAFNADNSTLSAGSQPFTTPNHPGPDPTQLPPMPPPSSSTQPFALPFQRPPFRPPPHQMHPPPMHPSHGGPPVMRPPFHHQPPPMPGQQRPPFFPQQQHRPPFAAPPGVGMGGPPRPPPTMAHGQSAPPAAMPVPSAPPKAPPANMPPTNDPQSQSAEETKKPVNTVEQRKQQVINVFKTWEVSPLAMWDDILRRVNDEQLTFGLSKKQLRQAFDKYQKSTPLPVKSKKKDKLAQAQTDYRQLMVASKVSSATTWGAFQTEHKLDPRFRNPVLKLKDKEALFRAYVGQLRDNKKQEARQHELDRQAYLQLLKDKRVTLRDTFGRMQPTLSRASAYKNLAAEQRRLFFDEYQSLLRKYGSVPVTPEEQRALEQKQEREQERRDRERASRAYKAHEAGNTLEIILAELVHDPYLEPAEVNKLIETDARAKDLEGLRPKEKEDIVLAHLERLTERRKREFHSLLDESEAVTLITPFAAVDEELKDQPRYQRYGRDDRERHAAYEEYLDRRIAQAKENFQTLLTEIKCITHKSYDEVKDLGLDSPHMKQILQALEHDKRYHVLDFSPEVRVELLFGYLRELKGRGAPPPPTAAK